MRSAKPIQHLGAADMLFRFLFLMQAALTVLRQHHMKQERIHSNRKQRSRKNKVIQILRQKPETHPHPCKNKGKLANLRQAEGWFPNSAENSV